MIVNLPRPAGCFVYDGIDPRLAPVRYASVDNAVEIIRRLCCESVLTELDLKDAYTIMPVHPVDHHSVGIAWQGHTYIDCCLPFGLHTAPKIFSAIPDALAGVFGCFGPVCQVHYFDDFLFVGASRSVRSSTLRIPLATYKSGTINLCGFFRSTDSLQLV
uniref:Reverse transcriptase domain-containing protein n=1 Tax=Amphimedon queenslandica TaxID=400682 RepID=A0A1X7VBK3_AMPQE